MILAAQKVHAASRNVAEEVEALKDVRPEMERLEEALRESHEKLDKLEGRLLEEVLRRIEERSARARELDVEQQRAHLQTLLVARTAECERLTSQLSHLNARAAADEQRLARLEAALEEGRLRSEAQGAELERLRAERGELLQRARRAEQLEGADERARRLEVLLETVKREHERALELQAGKLEKELADLRERARMAELGRSDVEARHQTELAQFADHAQARIRKLEDELAKKRRGLKALTEENLRLQEEVSALRRALEERAADAIPPPSPSRGDPEPRPALPRKP